MTDIDRAAIRAEHFPHKVAAGQRCSADRDPYPCRLIRLLERDEQMERELQRARKAFIEIVEEQKEAENELDEVKAERDRYKRNFEAWKGHAEYYKLQLAASEQLRRQAESERDEAREQAENAWKRADGWMKQANTNRGHAEAAEAERNEFRRALIAATSMEHRTERGSVYWTCTECGLTGDTAETIRHRQPLHNPEQACMLVKVQAITDGAAAS